MPGSLSSPAQAADAAGGVSGRRLPGRLLSLAFRAICDMKKLIVAPWLALEPKERLVVALGLKLGPFNIGWSEAHLKARRKGEPRKVELAWELRSQTTMPLAWIAERLNLGTRGHLAWLLQRRGQSRPTAPVDQCLLGI